MLNTNKNSFADKRTDSNVLPPLNKDGMALMYWFDAHEDVVHKPGVIHLFGKVYDESKRRWRSCCVFVENLDRIIHVAPRPGVEMAEVKAEIEELRKQHNIGVIRSRPVEKNYAFDVDGVPHGKSTYLEVRYPYSEPALQSNTQGRTFLHLFGAQRSGLETFIMNRNLMGPGFLYIKNIQPHSNSKTWCAFEGWVKSANDVEIAQFADNEKRPQAPSMNIMSLKVQTVMNHKSRQNEVVAVSMLIKSDGTPDAAMESPLFLFG
jgi:DNA polymerase alpha subunit A